MTTVAIATLIAVISIVLVGIFAIVVTAIGNKRSQDEYSCNCGLTDDEVKELTKEDV